MIFQALTEAANAGTLQLTEDGLCRFHRRRDGIVAIRELIVLPAHRRQGLGRQLVEQAAGGAQAVVARCPISSPSNFFWERIVSPKSPRLAPAPARR